jgi:D-alanyl-D-alanine carboxypeptidase/D-alanyl-D-alanine-endopeptidase (penicillin-binding protein 4)
MKHPHWFRVVLAMVLLAASSARGDLTGEIRAVLNDKLLSRGDVGVEIIRLGSTPYESQTLFESKSTVPRVPASNLKLVTTAAAVEKLGADFQFKTMLAVRGNDVALIGDGDPTLGDAEMLKKVGWGVDTVFKTWADLLKKRGITSVQDVYVDDSIFDEVFMHPNWPADQEHKRYVAQVGGVNLNANCVDFFLTTRGYGQTVDFRTDPATAYIIVGNTCVLGSNNAVWLSRRRETNDIVLRGETNASNDAPISVTIHDPPMYAATVLAETLQSNGITMTGQVKRDRTIRDSVSSKGPTTNPAQKWSAWAVHSTPISSVINRANKDSMNLYAEALCKRTGASVTGLSGSWENGVAAVGMFLESLGISKDEFALDDGCGLSKKNVISPHALARVLQSQFLGPNRDIYLKSMAVAGVDGTFEHRFRDSDLRGRVFGKSGYVNGVSSCSGYLRAKDGQWYAFSIIMNSLPEGTVLGAKQLQERIVKAVDAASVVREAAGR